MSLQTRGSKAISKEQLRYQSLHKSCYSVSPAVSIAKEQPLSWNEFQHAHAGVGWSKAQLSAAYAKAKTAAPTIEAEGLSWNAFQHANLGKRWSRQKMSKEYEAARQDAVDLRQQSADVPKQSQWNAYLHRHKGLGWTQVCAMTR